MRIIIAINGFLNIMLLLPSMTMWFLHTFRTKSPLSSSIAHLDHMASKIFYYNRIKLSKNLARFNSWTVLCALPAIQNVFFMLVCKGVYKKQCHLLCFFFNLCYILNYFFHVHISCSQVAPWFLSVFQLSQC